MSVKRLRAGDPRGVGPYRFLGRLGAAVHGTGADFLTVWCADTDGLSIYRDAGLAAACGAAVGFLALIGSSKEAVGVDGPYRATGVNR